MIEIKVWTQVKKAWGKLRKGKNEGAEQSRPRIGHQVNRWMDRCKSERVGVDGLIIFPF